MVTKVSKPFYWPIKMSNRKPIYGIGINDANYHTQKQAVVCGRRTTVWCCPFYKAWTNMLKRCHSQASKSARPTYSGCVVADEWLSFMSFRAWMIEQPWHGNQQDKDLLLPGNKIYSSDTCVFISQDLNTFLIDRLSRRGAYPLGVTWHEPNNKYRSRCCNPFGGKYEHLGLFSTPESAHEAWRARKHQHACRYADMQSDPRIAEALRIRYLPSREHK